MNRHDRRKAKARAQRPIQKGTWAEPVRAFLDGTVLHNAPDAPHVAIGPLVWGINPKDGRHWYFVCASADAEGQFHLDCLTIGNDDREMAEETRSTAFMELMQRRPIVVHDFDDEVRFARFNAALGRENVRV